MSKSLTPYEKLELGQEVFSTPLNKKGRLQRHFSSQHGRNVYYIVVGIEAHYLMEETYGKTWGLAKEFPVDRRVSFQEAVDKHQAKALTGGSSDYYKIQVDHPTTEGNKPYLAECNDIIEALGLSFAEGNILKAIWRSAAKRQGNGKQGTTERYDLEKIVFFAKRLLTQIETKEQTSC